MVAVRTSIPGFLVALAAIGAFIVACARHDFMVAGPSDWNLDKAIFMAAKAGAVYCLIFGTVHLVLHHIKLGHRWLYALAGAASATAVFWLWTDPANFAEMRDQGYAIASFVAPVALGALMGFAYHLRAGYSAAGDDPHALRSLFASRDEAAGHQSRYASHRRQARAGQASDSGLATGTAGGVPPDNAHADTGTAEYFSGPLRVRTSFGTMIVAAIAGTILFHFAMLFMFFASWLRPRQPGAITDPNSFSQAIERNFSPFSGVAGLSDLIDVFAATGAGAIIWAALFAIPFAAIIYVCHMVARAMDKTSYMAYGVAGLVVPPILGLLLFFVFFFVGLQMAFPCAIAMLLYRNYAGLEPKPVAEDVHVDDRRNLVGAGHERRRFGRVIASQ